MINPAQIPPEVVEAAAIGMWREGAPHITWDETVEEAKEVFRRKARAAIAAALAAWPMWTSGELSIPGGTAPCFILPLPQEARDDH